MSYYKDIFSQLIASPPTKWAITHYGDGVYLWPHDLNWRMIRITQPPDTKLWRYQILFEFHRTPSGSARILARARYDNLNRAVWDCFWKCARDAGAPEPKEVSHATATRSVAKWDVPNIGAISTAVDSAQAVCDLLIKPPPSLTNFVKAL
jgi:hypothetical protein